MIDLDNQTMLMFEPKTLEKIAEILTKRDIELLIVDDMTIKELNRIHRGINHATDVLSFPMELPYEDMNFPLGTIVIASSFVLEKAKEFKHTTTDEISLLFIHGLLHLLGFDHECDNTEMRDEEKRVIKMFDLPKSLIVRSKEY